MALSSVMPRFSSRCGCENCDTPGRCRPVSCRARNSTSELFYLWSLSMSQRNCESVGEQAESPRHLITATRRGQPQHKHVQKHLAGLLGRHMGNLKR